MQTNTQIIIGLVVIAIVAMLLFGVESFSIVGNIISGFLGILTGVNLKGEYDRWKTKDPVNKLTSLNHK